MLKVDQQTLNVKVSKSSVTTWTFKKDRNSAEDIAWPLTTFSITAERRKVWTEMSVMGSDFGHDSVLLTSFSQIDNWATQMRLFSSFFSALSLLLTKWSWNISRTICIFFIIFLSQHKTWTLTVRLEQKSGRILYFSNIDFFKVNKFPPVGAWLDLPGY